MSFVKFTDGPLAGQSQHMNGAPKPLLLVDVRVPIPFDPTQDIGDELSPGREKIERAMYELYDEQEMRFEKGTFEYLYRYVEPVAPEQVKEYYEGRCEVHCYGGPWDGRTMEFHNPLWSLVVECIVKGEARMARYELAEIAQGGSAASRLEYTFAGYEKSCIVRKKEAAKSEEFNRSRKIDLPEG